MKKTAEISSISETNILSMLTSEDIKSFEDVVRRKELRDFSEMECDDFFGDALVHLCEMANQGYFDKKTLNSKADLKASAFTIFRNKVRDARDKETTRVKRMDNEYFENVSEMYWGSFDSEGDDVSKKTVKLARKILDTLPGKEGEVLRMTIDHTDDEIMAKLGMTRNNVQKTRCTARAKVVKAIRTQNLGHCIRRSKAHSSAEDNTSADFFVFSRKSSRTCSLLWVKTNKHSIMKKIKKNYIYDRAETAKSNRQKMFNLSRSIAEERLSFRDGTELGSLSIAIEDGYTKRKIRRIVEKRVNQDYWNHVNDSRTFDNKHRAASKKYVSKVTRKIFGEPLTGFSHPVSY